MRMAEHCSCGASFEVEHDDEYRVMAWLERWQERHALACEVMREQIAERLSQIQDKIAHREQVNANRSRAAQAVAARKRAS